MHWPWGRVVVAGPSMVPTLRAGDQLVVRRGARIRAGDLVVVAHPRRPDLLLVKRAIRRSGDGWWVVGDNPAGSEDSREFGPARPRARVVWRYWPPVRRRS